MAVAYYIVAQGVDFISPPDNGYGAQQVARLDDLLSRKGVYSSPDYMAQGMQSLEGFEGNPGPATDIEEFEQQIEGLDSSLQWFCAKQGILALQGLLFYLKNNPELGDTTPAQDWIEFSLVQLEILAQTNSKWHMEVRDEQALAPPPDELMVLTSSVSLPRTHYQAPQPHSTVFESVPLT